MPKHIFSDHPNIPPSTFRTCLPILAAAANRLASAECVEAAEGARANVEAVLRERPREEKERSNKTRAKWCRLRLDQDKRHILAVRANVAPHADSPGPQGVAARTLVATTDMVLTRSSRRARMRNRCPTSRRRASRTWTCRTPVCSPAASTTTS